MSTGPVAVIDLGSNSIKVLVADRGADGQLVARKMRTVDARISAGISQSRPRLSEEGMARGIDAVKTLLDEAATFSPRRIALVATSAVRDAANGADFQRRIAAATSQSLRILSGEEEANLIGRGLTCDPALAELRDFQVFDLGGGSLECLSFRDRRIRQAVSLPLGCVRLTEKFVPDPSQPFAQESHTAIAQHVQAALPAGGFKFHPDASLAVGTGGTLTTARAVLGARKGLELEQTDSLVTVAQLRELLAWIGALPLSGRRQIAGLPPARADIFPAALATFIALAESGGFEAYRHSFYNLRWGLAAELLEANH